MADAALLPIPDSVLIWDYGIARLPAPISLGGFGIAEMPLCKAKGSVAAVPPETSAAKNKDAESQTDADLLASKIPRRLAQALEADQQKIKVYILALIGTEYFGLAAVREAQWKNIADLQWDLEEQAAQQQGLFEACEQDSTLSAILESKGLRAIPVINSAFRLKKMLNELLDTFEGRGLANIFQEGQAAGNVSKLGAKKTAHTKVLLTHGMLQRLGTSIDLQALQQKGILVWDLREWTDVEIRLDCWKRQQKDANTGFYGIEQKSLKPAKTRLYVHALDLAYDDDRDVKRVSIRKDVALNACAKLTAEAVARHVSQAIEIACDLLRAVDFKEEHVCSPTDVREPFTTFRPPRERYKIPVWISLYDPEAEGCFTSLDHGFAAASKRVREGTTERPAQVSENKDWNKRAGDINAEQVPAAASSCSSQGAWTDWSWQTWRWNECFAMVRKPCSASPKSAPRSAQKKSATMYDVRS